MMQLVVVEDEYIQLEEYRILCEQYLQGEQYKITCYIDAEGLQEHMKLGKPIDILIMDIRLSNANGIELAKQVKRIYPHTAVIFISAYLEYAPFVYEVDHVYFIYKKNTLNRFPKALSKAIKHYHNKERNILPIHWKKEVILLSIPDIIYIEREGRKTNIIMCDEEQTVYQKIDDIMNQLPEDLFIRIHHSFIINFDYIRSFSRDKIIMKNGKELPVSRSYKKTAKEKIYHLMDESMV